MNREKRAMLREALVHIDYASDITKRVLSMEEDSFDNMPENLENSDTYEKMERAIDNLEDAIDSLSDAKESVQEAM